MAEFSGDFLVKIRNPAGGRLRLSARLGAAGAEVAFETEPLFRSVGTGAGRGLRAAGGQWRVARARAQIDEREAWAACHRLASDPNVEVAEPDLAQQWPVAPPSRPARGFGARTGAPKPQNIGAGYAGDPKNDYWFRDARHSQIDAALMECAGGAGVRIAHLDTGYDPDHASVPKNLERRLARNFVDKAFPNDATDRAEGVPFGNFSHGCGTLSILASPPISGLKPFGCAPEASVVPVRVANRVALFWTSTVARGLDYVHELCAADATRVHVVTMSMGGLPSPSWAEAINALYEAGVVVVTAAGNNFGNLPTRYVVYPARFGRVIAACGVMADGTPYANLRPDLMAGNYGPDSKAPTAIAAYTPNVPWARFGEPKVVDFDGAGTSSATPQVAASAALWIEKQRAKYDAYREPWMRVEAVRKALFGAAAQGAPGYHEEFGAGLLRAADALAQGAAPATGLVKTAADSAGAGFLKLLIGDAAPGMAAAAETRPSQLDLEAAQAAVRCGFDPGVKPRTEAGRREIIDKILSEGHPSPPLRAALGRTGRPSSPAAAPAKAQPPKKDSAADVAMAEHFLRLALNPKAPDPPYRRLRIYAYDPAQRTDPELFDVSVATVTMTWEGSLQRGPVGDYIEIVDIDPASRACYAPVDLNDPKLLAESGLTPSEANPQFHQQMAYAVAMRTIDRFERALGRKALWARRKGTDDRPPPDDGYVRRLRIYPHALRDENAYYDPEKIALLFGYFNARNSAGSVTEGVRIFSVVSHDIVAHETTHALLDGLHPRYSEGSNLDMAAFHEAFADIVALFQHFSMPESLTRQIRKARGSPADIGRRLGQLAVQFGEATGMHGALRRFVSDTGSSIPVLSNDTTDPHDRGAVLVSAVFAAFLTIFRSRCADLIRLATNGSGILPDGDISVDLANRLASEASKTAEHVLNMCIRALDYCPPVNLEFGDYLRGLLTADYDLIQDDARGYRVAFIDAFRQRGIVPYQIGHLAEDSLLWEPPAMDPKDLRMFDALFTKDQPGQSRFALDLRVGTSGDGVRAEGGGESADHPRPDGDSPDGRKEIFDRSLKNAATFKAWLEQDGDDFRRLRAILGFEPPARSIKRTVSDPNAPQSEEGRTTIELVGEIRPIEVHSVRICRRTAPDGALKTTLVVELTQTFRSRTDEERYRGGCTLLLDLNTNRLKYLVRKKLLSSYGIESQMRARAFAMESAADQGQVYFAPNDPAVRGKTFAMMHRAGRSQ